MGIAVDTVLCAAINPGAGPAVATVTASGDSLSVRNSNPARKAYLENMIRAGAASGFVQVRSPMLHDNVRGIRITPNESPSLYSMPDEVDQVLQPQDALIVELSGGAAETDLAILQLYYEDLPGISARLHNWSEIQNNVKSVKTLSVAVTSSATIGAWVDTVITTTENLLHANTDYAIVGYTSSAVLSFIGVKGAETGNLRIGGPGSSLEFGTSDYFVLMNQRNGRPWVPVFNSANAGGFFVSVAANTASVAATVELILVELSSNLSN
jgi:hypothetical protein